MRYTKYLIFFLLLLPSYALADTQLLTTGGGTSATMRYADGSTSNPERLCQSFVGVAGDINYIKAFMSQRGSGGSATETAGVQGDSAGSPSGTYLQSGTLPFTSLTGSSAQYTINFGSAFTMTPGATYWLCFSSSANNDGSDGVYVYGDTTGGGAKYLEGGLGTYAAYGTNQVTLEFWTTGGGGGGGGGTTATTKNPIQFETFQVLSFSIASAIWLLFTVSFIRWFIGFVTGRPARR